MNLKMKKSGIVKIIILVILISILLIMQIIENKINEDRNRLIDEFYKSRTEKNESVDTN